MADILSNGRVVFGLGRGYHTREVETFGSPLRDQEGNRELFEEQVDIIFNAFNNDAFSHKGKHYTLRRKCLSWLHLEGTDSRSAAGPSAGGMLAADPGRQRTRLDFMAKHGIQGMVGGGSARAEQCTTSC